MAARRAAHALSLLALVLAFAAAAPASAGHRPELDLSGASRSAARPVTIASRTQLNRALSAEAMRAHVRLENLDERFDVPSFVWGIRSHVPAAGTASARPLRSPEQAARAHLAGLGGVYHLDANDVSGAVLHEVHDVGRGGIIARFRQRVNGIDVFREETSVLMDRQLNLLAVSGSIPGRALATSAAAQTFALPADRAIAIALEDFAQLSAEPTGVTKLGAAEGGYERYATPSALAGLPERFAVAHPVRVKPVYFRQADALVPAFYAEVMGEVEAYAYVIDAGNGAVLFRHDLTESDVFNYRVWASSTDPKLPDDGPQGTSPTPHPTGLPDNYTPSFIAPSLIALQNGPLSTNDPWLPPGASESTGNNVDAYADLAAPDGFSAGDLRASTTTPGTFDRVYNTSFAPNASPTQRQAAITQLFYDTNFFHDWFYDAGYNEASGNMQTSNLGRGGLGGDPLHAEAQDYSGANNANMSTPADGASGRMQMYVWVGVGISTLTVNAPAAIAGSYAMGTADFGKQVFNVTGQVAAGVDAIAPTGDGCSAFTNSVSGKIALVDRGSCTYSSQLHNALVAGAIGVILVDNVPAGVTPPHMAGTSTANIPMVSVTQATGNLIKAQLGAGVNVTLVRTAVPVDRDGTIDNQIVAHEWGHNISNRLIGNANGLSNPVGSGMGEGWADFHAMLLTVRPEDAAAPNNANFNGVYAMAGYAVDQTRETSNAYYFGIRRYPYSTDLTKNPLTFKHITNGTPLPEGPPVAYGADGAINAEAHNTGEVWCAMLWECYAALLRDTGRLTFNQARDRMRDELVAAYKLTPNAPTFVEARNALLAAALARDVQDYNLFWAAFAKRGLGVGAIAPDRYAPTNQGVVESFAVGGDLAFAGATLTDDVASCDADGYVDNGETGTLHITLANAGSTTLGSTSASVSSSLPGVTFPAGNTVAFPALGLLGDAAASIPVRATGLAGASAADFVIQYNDPSLVVPGPRTATFYAWLNADEAPSRTDGAESIHTSWTAGAAAGSGGVPWSSASGAGSNHVYHGEDAPSFEDQYLISAPMQVPVSGDFAVTFQHAYQFEQDPTGSYDGGVLELSTDDGGSWSDIGASATPGYNGVVYATSGNPLAGRNAWVGTSASYPAMDNVTVSLGSAYAGQTVRIRFRLGADQNAGGAGWSIDEVSVPNAVNAPFVALVGNPGDCQPLDVPAASAPHALSFALASRNPADGSTTRFRIGLPSAQHVRVVLYDIAGREVARVANGEYSAGWHDVAWSANGGRRATGVYLARMTVDGKSLHQRVVVIR